MPADFPAQVLNVRCVLPVEGQHSAGSGVAAIRATMVGTRGDFRPVHKCARPTHNAPSAPTSNTSHAKGCSGSALHCEVKDRSAADE